MKILKLLVLTSLVILYSKSKAQEVITSGGDYFHNGINSMSSTIGEAVTETFTGAENILTQGFQQGKLEFLSVDEVTPSEIIITAYPNPVKEKINISIKNAKNENFSFKLYDLTGRLKLEDQINLTDFEVSLHNFPNSVYLLKVFENQEEIKEILIIKQ